MKTADDFIEFLKDKKVYRQFKDSVENLENRDLFVYVKEMEKEIVFVVSDAFSWSMTEEGFAYWNDIEMKWLAICNKKD